MAQFSRTFALSFASILVSASVGLASSTGNSSLLRACRGSYSGVAGLQSVAGESVYYDPIQMTVSKRGKVSGQAQRKFIAVDSALSSTGLVSVKGLLTRLQRKDGIVTCNLSARTSDGSLFKLQIMSVTLGGFTTKSMSGFGRNGGFRGQISLIGP